MAITAILGAFWGDEGKGKIACHYALDAEICARFQGGPNAGHTVYHQNQELVFRMIPAGGVYARYALIGSGALINPEMLLEEFEWFVNLKKDLDSLRISKNAHVILPSHIEADVSDDSLRVGSTGMGVGPCYANKARRVGVRVIDLLERDCSHLEVPAALVLKFREILGQYCIDAEEFLRGALLTGAKVIAEGAQGSLLDIDHGQYPFVTSSNTTIGAVLTGLGAGPRDVENIIVVASAYMTKVGGGIFPSRMEARLELELQQRGNEIDGATGKIRQCGWLDVDALEMAVRINQATGLIITKLDILSGIGRLQINRGGRVIKELDGWNEDISTMDDYKDLPSAAKNYIKEIENYAQASVVAISNGRNTEKIILCK